MDRKKNWVYITFTQTFKRDQAFTIRQYISQYSLILKKVTKPESNFANTQAYLDISLPLGWGGPIFLCCASRKSLVSRKIDTGCVWGRGEGGGGAGTGARVLLC